MDGAKLQLKLLKGYATAARVIGTPFDVYRSASMMTPIALGNKIATLPASFTTGLNYATYNKPNAPLWTVLIDASSLLPGDWLVDGSNTYFLADIQPLLPLPAVGCSTTVSIARPSYGTATAGGYETTDSLIAQNLPVFMIGKKDKTTSPHWFPGSTDSVVATPEWQFYINSRVEGAVKAHDVIIDSQGTRYEIDTLSFTSFGYIVTARIEKP